MGKTHGGASLAQLNTCYEAAVFETREPELIPIRRNLASETR